jgi:hypothetical protein
MPNPPALLYGDKGRGVIVASLARHKEEASEASQHQHPKPLADRLHQLRYPPLAKTPKGVYGPPRADVHEEAPALASLPSYVQIAVVWPAAYIRQAVGGLVGAEKTTLLSNFA